MRFQTAVPAFHIPEFLKSDISAETALGNVIIKQFQTYAVRYNRRLAHSDVRERPGMDHAWLVFCGAHERRGDGISHICGHGAADLKILGGYRLASLVECQSNLIQTFSQICEISNN